MFKAKRIDSGEIQTILAVEFNTEFHQTYFIKETGEIIEEEKLPF